MKNDPKNPIFQNFEKQKMRFFLMSQGSFSPKIRFLGQKVCSVARRQTDRQTDRQTRKWIQRTPFQGFRIFQIFLQPIIKERSNTVLFKIKRTLCFAYKINIFLAIHGVPCKFGKDICNFKDVVFIFLNPHFYVNHVKMDFPSKVIF